MTYICVVPGKYRQTLLDKKAVEEIDSAKALFRERRGKTPTSREVIHEFLGRRLRFLRLPREIRSYLNAFVSRAVLNEDILGLMLFGSGARNAYGEFSDVDVLVLVKGGAMAQFDEVNRVIGETDVHRKGLLEKGLHLRIRPLVISADELGRFRPMYIDLLEDGVILFERNDSLTDFLDEILRTVDYEKTVVNDSVMIRWKIRK